VAGTDWNFIYILIMAVSFAIIASMTGRIEKWCREKPYRGHVLLTAAYFAVFGVIVYSIFTGTFTRILMETPSQNRILEFVFISLAFIVLLLVKHSRSNMF
jgi:uncharacterized membrane protein